MKIYDTMVSVPGGKMYCRHSKIDLHLPSILFLHGIGDSGLAFIEAFHHTILGNYNILVPDLLGFGTSTDAADDDYSFIHQIERILHFIDHFKISPPFLVGHSMGGDIGVLMCEQHPDQVPFFVNVEGDLTIGDRFITSALIQADKAGRFEHWFHNDLCRDIVIKWSYTRPSCIRYLASLGMCRLPAFLQSAYEIYQLNETLPDKTESLIGYKYREISVPKVYCWGTDSLSAESQRYLRSFHIDNRRFSDAHHWVMLDKTKDFYDCLAQLFSAYHE